MLRRAKHSKIEGVEPKEEEVTYKEEALYLLGSVYNLGGECGQKLEFLDVKALAVKSKMYVRGYRMSG
jgi:hypothetical protein